MSKESDKWLLMFGIGGVAAVVVISSLAHTTASEPWKIRVVIETKAAPTSTYGPGKLVDPQPSGVVVPQEVPLVDQADMAKSALDKKNINDKFEVTHKDGNRYLVEKTGRDSFKVIAPIGEEHLSLKYPLPKEKLTSRNIIAVQ